MSATDYETLPKSQKIEVLADAILALRKRSPANFSEWSWNKSREFSDCYSNFAKARSLEKCEMSAMRFASFYGISTVDELVNHVEVAA